MSATTARSLLLHALVLLPLALAAGWAGATLGGPAPTEPAAPSEGGAGESKALLRFVDELDRRVGALEGQREAGDVRWQSMGDQLQEVLRRLERIEQQRAAAAPSGTDDGQPAQRDPLEAAANAVEESIQEQAAKVVAQNSKYHLEHQMKLFADGTSAGEENRRKQAFVEARHFATRFRLDPEPLNELLLSHWARGHAEIGGLVQAGLADTARTDRATVRERLQRLNDRRDDAIAAMLPDEKTKKSFDEEREARRKLLDQLFASYDQP